MLFRIIRQVMCLAELAGKAKECIDDEEDKGFACDGAPCFRDEDDSVEAEPVKESAPAKKAEPKKAAPAKKAEPKKSAPAKKAEPKESAPAKKSEPKKAEPVKKEEPKQAEPEKKEEKKEEK